MRTFSPSLFRFCLTAVACLALQTPMLAQSGKTAKTTTKATSDQTRPKKPGPEAAPVVAPKPQPPVKKAAAREKRPSAADPATRDASRTAAMREDAKRDSIAKLQGTKGDPRVLFTVNEEPTTVGEFLTVFNKNNYKDTAASQAAMQEYLDLYTKFKLKVAEAKSRGLDTTEAFRREFKKYRAQLASPYLTDRETTQRLVQEAYDRTKTERRASHILILCTEDALPKDTLTAYRRAVKLRDMAMKGTDFGQLASDSSQDRSARTNKGDLGYFGALRMIYQFENRAYSTPMNQISPVFRTKFGYHFLKVTGERPAPGELRVAHILILAKATDGDQKLMEAKNKINEVYRLAKEGRTEFSELARTYSEDQTSAKNGGTLPPFGSGRMVPEFEVAAYALKNQGDISEPIQSQFGFHVIQLLERKPIGSYEQLRAELESKINRDTRANLNKTTFIGRLKKEYKFTEMAAAREEVFARADSTLPQGKWGQDKALGLRKPLLTYGPANERVTKTQEDFVIYLAQNQPPAPVKESPASLMKKSYDQFVDKTLMEFEDNRLEAKLPDFAALMREYYEGILLFDLTDREVWSRASTDTAGLRAFHAPRMTNYMWKERAEADIFSTKDEKVAMAARKMALSGGSKKTEVKVTENGICWKTSTKGLKYTADQIATEQNKVNPLNLRVQSGKFELGQQELIDSLGFKPMLSPIFTVDGSKTFVRVKCILKPQPKALEEARGLITSDYQQYLEKEWVAGLESKYRVRVDQAVFQSILPR